MRPSRHTQNGFTLFEVLGAVALLAIVYTMLSTTAIRGLRTEAKSRRILEASMLADRVLAELELELDRGAMRELGAEETESEDGLYRILIEVMLFDLPEVPAAPQLVGSGGSNLPSATGSANSVPLFGSWGESPLREIRVRVGWGNPDDEIFVERSTFGIDPLAIQLAAGSQLSDTAPTR